VRHATNKNNITTKRQNAIIIPSERMCRDNKQYVKNNAKKTTSAGCPARIQLAFAADFTSDLYCPLKRLFALCGACDTQEPTRREAEAESNFKAPSRR